MKRIILNEDQMRDLAGVTGIVDIVGPRGELVGALNLLTEEDKAALEEYRRRKGQPPSPCVPGERVHAFLLKLHELDDQGKIDETTVKEMLRRTVAGEQL